MSKSLNDYAKAASMIRNFLKAQGVPGKVRSEGYSMGSSVNVYIEDVTPETSDKVEKYAKQFQYGHFDGMQDLYEYSNSRNDIPQAKFVFVNNKPSELMKQKIWLFALNYYDLKDAPADADQASNYFIKDWNAYCSELIYRLYKGGFNNNAFWDFANLEKQAA
jgi:hypothetical protein